MRNPISTGAIDRWCACALTAIAIVALGFAAPAQAGENAAPQTPAPATTAAPSRQGMQDRLAACAYCHGDQGQGDMDQRGGVYPRLAGQPEQYLYQQMTAFVSDQRTGIPPVAVMRDLLKDLSPDYLQRIAAFYAGATPAYPPPLPYTAAQLQAGRALVERGLPAKRIPSCVSCHGAKLEGRAPATPALAGQNARYLTVQLMHWLTGQRSGALHQHIAQTLSEQQVQAMSAYLSALRPQPAGAAQ